jgi:hypothetical protein
MIINLKINHKQAKLKIFQKEAWALNRKFHTKVINRIISKTLILLIVGNSLKKK